MRSTKRAEPAILWNIECGYKKYMGPMKKKKENTTSDTVIGKGAVLRGELEIESNLNVEGILSGDRLATQEVMVVAAGGEVEAKSIEVGKAHIKGKVSGVIKAREQVHISAGAVLKGRGETPWLVLEEGAILKVNGKET